MLENGSRNLKAPRSEVINEILRGALHNKSKFVSRANEQLERENKHLASYIDRRLFSLPPLFRDEAELRVLIYYFTYSFGAYKENSTMIEVSPEQIISYEAKTISEREELNERIQEILDSCADDGSAITFEIEDVSDADIKLDEYIERERLESPSFDIFWKCQEVFESTIPEDAIPAFGLLYDVVNILHMQAEANELGKIFN